MKAADIRDHYVLQSIARHATGIGAPRHAIESDLPDFPPKVVKAKLHALLRRKLITGCVCGCRGDFALTANGDALRQNGPVTLQPSAPSRKDETL